MTILDDALGWHGAGCAMLPVQPNGSKAPAVPWREYLNVAPDVATIERWFTAGEFDGFGVVCGTASSQLELLEVEGRAVVEVGALAQLCADNGLSDVWDRLTNGYVEATPSGGIHWLFRVGDGPAKGNTKLARSPDGVKWETRGQGGFVVVAPSAGRTHPTGRAWTTIAGTPASIPTLTVSERDALYAVVTMLDETPPAPEPIRTSPSFPAGDVGDRPGDDFEARTDWSEILPNWTVVRRFSGGGLGWRRDGKDTPGISATTGMRADADRLYVFSSSTAFEAERPYSKFGAYALLRHGGDHAAAARELRQRGFGADRPRPPEDWSWAPPSTLPGYRPFAADPPGSALPARDESQVATTQSSDYGHRLVKGGAFLFDRPRRPVAVWGERADVLWSQGEPCIITGPIGAGKTTLLGRLVHASLSLSRRVLDFPVSETERVLYFASDRPAQIARNLARMFDEDDRDELDERLVVWQGPPPMDVAKNPAILLEIAQAVGATRVFVDGLKDVAAKISEEETGQGLNRAMQLLVVEGIDVVANHHQRKAGGAGLSKPKTLDDVYGSNWISAGAGTVVLLWVTEAGAQDVELSTIKPAADIVGPLPLLHETDLGTLELKPEVDDGESPRRPNPASVTDVLLPRRHTTMTAKEIAKALRWPEKDVERKTRQIRRACDALIEDGLVKDHPMPKARGGSPESNYQWIGE